MIIKRNRYDTGCVFVIYKVEAIWEFRRRRIKAVNCRTNPRDLSDRTTSEAVHLTKLSS